MRGYVCEESQTVPHFHASICFRRYIYLYSGIMHMLCLLYVSELHVLFVLIHLLISG